VAPAALRASTLAGVATEEKQGLRATLPPVAPGVESPIPYRGRRRDEEPVCLAAKTRLTTALEQLYGN
jgi:hypothetical protein